MLFRSIEGALKMQQSGSTMGKAVVALSGSDFVKVQSNAGKFVSLVLHPLSLTRGVQGYSLAKRARKWRESEKTAKSATFQRTKAFFFTPLLSQIHLQSSKAITKEVKASGFYAHSTTLTHFYP